MNIFNFIKSNIAILSVIGEYATLRKTGLYWKGQCPFHHERTASFTVSPHKEIYYCFGCHKGGDVIAFIAEVEHCSQIEAARHIVERYGLAIPEHFVWENTDEITQKKRRNTELYSLITQWCHEQLEKDVHVQTYFEKRGFTKNSMSQFSLGFFPAGQSSLKNLSDFLKKKGFLRQDLLDQKIFIEGKTLYSPFEDRIIFPIKDHLGRFCAFGGRIFRPADERPKYYNSHENEFFNKGSILFGFDQAKKTIQSTSAVFLVEGYTDCIAMHQAGFKNTVATLGTACTADHLKQLSRYAQQVYLVYDGDVAGQNAILRLTQLCWQVELELSVIELPEKEDPASFIQKNGNFEELLKKEQDIFLFFINRMSVDFQSKKLQERVRIAEQLLNLIAGIPNAIKQDFLLQKASSTFDIPFETLKSRLQPQNNRSKHKESRQDTEKVENKNYLKEITILEKKLFYAILNQEEIPSPEDLEFLKQFITWPLNELIQKLEIHKKEFFNFSLFFDNLSPDEKAFVAPLVMESEDQVSDRFSDLFAQFLKKQWKMTVNDVKMKLLYKSGTLETENIKKIEENFQKLKQMMLQKGLI